MVGPRVVLLDKDGAPPRRAMIASLGKMPMTSVRSLISPLKPGECVRATCLRAIVAITDSKRELLHCAKVRLSDGRDCGRESV